MSTLPSSTDAPSTIENVRETTKEYLDIARDKADELSGSAEQMIRRQPTAALIAAAGIGFVLGACWMRR